MLRLYDFVSGARETDGSALANERPRFVTCCKHVAWKNETFGRFFYVVNGTFPREMPIFAVNSTLKVVIYFSGRGKKTEDTITITDSS